MQLYPVISISTCVPSMNIPAFWFGMCRIGSEFDATHAIVMTIDTQACFSRCTKWQRGSQVQRDEIDGDCVDLKTLAASVYLGAYSMEGFLLPTNKSCQ